MTDSFRLNGSLRYTNEEKDIDHGGSRVLFSAFGPGPLADPVKSEYELDDHWSGHIGVDWIVSSDAMAYIKYTKGFKSGGFFGGIPLSADEVIPYDEEIVHAYEVGFKSDWLDQTLRVNGAAFYYDYQNVQGYVQYIGLGGSPFTTLGTMGDAEHKGVELDLIWLPQSVEGLRTEFNMAWLDAEIVNSDVVTFRPVSGTPSGTRQDLKRSAPEWSGAIKVIYEKPIIANYIAGAQVSYSYRGDLLSERNVNDAEEVGLFGQESYGLLNARLTFEPADSSWQVALVGKNLGAKEYVINRTGDGVGSAMSLPARPRSWALEAMYRWE